MTTLLIIILHMGPPAPPIFINFNNIKSYSDNKPTKMSIYKKVPGPWSKITKNSN